MSAWMLDAIRAGSLALPVPDAGAALPWLALLLLGAVHGVNPGMGWLFAVALGLQRRRGSAVWRALPPLAAGHALAIVGALAVAAAVGLVLPLSVLRWAVAAILVGFGVYKLLRSRHPRYGGMRVGAKDLTIWSFLMASAHGAGLMVVPFVLGAGGGAEAAMAGAGSAMGGAAAAGHAGHAAGAAGGHAAQGLVAAGLPGGDVWASLLASVAHTAGYLLVTALVAAVVYRKVGVRFLRTGWVNLDLVWAVALILTGLVTPFL